MAIELALLLVAGLARPASHVPEFISYYLLASAVFVTACWLVARGDEALSAARSLRWIWVAALVFRLTVLHLQPSLSEDAARYRWQGMLQDAGGDPYIAVPMDPAWDGLRDSTWPRIAGRDRPSAYGPVVEQLNLWHFRLVSALEPEPPAQVWLFKVPFALADLAVGWALMGLLSAVGRPRAWTLVYLWSPLAVTEFWIEGHNDSLALLFAVLALGLAARSRRIWALPVLSVAAMCKFWPAVLFPFLLVRRRNGRWSIEWKGALLSLVVLAALCLPYWSSIVNVVRSVAGFAGGWRNNDSLFAIFLELTGGNMVAAAAISGCALVLSIVVLRTLALPPLAGELSAVCAVLLLAANCFPWYLTWMLPLLAVHPNPGLLLWTALASLAYHVIPGYEASGVWGYDGNLIRLEYLPVLTWLGVSVTQHLRRSLGTQDPRGKGVAGSPNAPGGAQ